jgi:hypothetical protein
LFFSFETENFKRRTVSKSQCIARKMPCRKPSRLDGGEATVHDDILRVTRRLVSTVPAFFSLVSHDFKWDVTKRPLRAGDPRITSRLSQGLGRASTWSQSWLRQTTTTSTAHGVLVALQGYLMANHQIVDLAELEEGEFESPSKHDDASHTIRLCEPNETPLQRVQARTLSTSEVLSKSNLPGGEVVTVREQFVGTG